MRVIFLDKMKYPTLYKAKKSADWAYKIKKCYFGWMAFESIEDYENFKIEDKKQKVIPKTSYNPI